MHPHITGVDYTTSDIPTPVPEPTAEMTEGDNNEAEEGEEEINDEDETGDTTQPQIIINEYSDIDSDIDYDT